MSSVRFTVAPSANGTGAVLTERSVVRQLSLARAPPMSGATSDVRRDVVKVYAPWLSVVADVVRPLASWIWTVAPGTGTPPGVTTCPVTSACAVALSVSAAAPASAAQATVRRRTRRVTLIAPPHIATHPHGAPFGGDASPRL